MDINIYNIHFVVGLFGKPEKVQYLANIERDIDTSGILVLDYGAFKAVCIVQRIRRLKFVLLFKGQMVQLKCWAQPMKCHAMNGEAKRR